jgi:hypothetical protein
MQPLRELQADLAQAILSGDTGRARAAVVDDAPGAEARLAIYRNHYRVSLIETLAAAFPMVARRLGDTHFRPAARGYILTTPPVDPVLAAYGAGFPAFLGKLLPLAAWPWISDLARLEWALHVAWHAPDAPALPRPPLAASQFSPAGDIRLRLHPSCRAVASRFAIDRLWRGEDDGERTREEGEPVRLLVFRAGRDVGWVRLPAPEFAFIASLIADGRLGQATAVARAIDPTATNAALIEAFAPLGIFVDVVPVQSAEGG